MHMYDDKATICAIATPPGTGAIAVIRLSGEKSFEIISGVFKNKKNKPVDFNRKPSHTLHFGHLYEGDKVIDEVLVSIFKNPHSYTGEDTIEISCHGSMFIQEQIINLILKNGARLANPGEFTFRAFMNSKLDLAQAEAVAELIAADNESRHRIAIQQIRGGFSDEIKKLRDELIHFASLIELELDFSEEDVEFANREQLKKLVQTLKLKLQSLVESFEQGNVIRNGVPVVIAGKPNVGKSTLLNALLNEERAIVSHIAGTTRDTIEEEIVLGGINFRFIDTAGIRETIDVIEKTGVQRTLDKMHQSSVILYLLDIYETTPQDLEKIINEIESKTKNTQPIIIPVINKSDLLKEEELKPYQKFENLVTISAKVKLKLDILKNILLEKTHLSQVNYAGTIVVNARHYESLVKTNNALQRVLNGLGNKVTNDFLASDIRDALYHLGLISGEVSTDDLLQNIFSRFCIGK